MLRAVPLALGLFLLAPVLSAEADEVYPIVFPVDGPNHYTDTWGAARAGGRTHEGTDIMADKMTPVVAAASGTVGWMSSTCCAFELVHDDGYRSRYIHLNNDTPGTDDGQGWGYALGIERGAHVTAGQLVGYVGDSGNAEWTGSHLHFELRYPDGTAFNSYPSLLVAAEPDMSQVTWHVGSISNSRIKVDTKSLTSHVRESDGLAVWGDFDGDGASEVAVGGGLSPGWEISEAGGAGSMWSTRDDASAVVVHSADFDGDGDDDIAAFRSDRTWVGYRSSGSSFKVESWGKFGGSGWADQILGDFDGDGATELVSFHSGTKNWWISDLVGGGWRHSIFTSYGTTSGWSIHMAADTDGDGADELLSFHPSNGTWWSSARGSSPRLVYNVVTNSGWRHLSAADVDGDDADELIMFHPSNGSWWVVDRSTSRAYLWGRFSTKTGWITPHVADVNVDGYEDIMIRHRPSGNVWAILGRTNGKLVFVGKLVAGSDEGAWLVAHPDTGLGLVALTRS